MKKYRSLNFLDSQARKMQTQIRNELRKNGKSTFPCVSSSSLNGCVIERHIDSKLMVIDSAKFTELYKIVKQKYLKEYLQD